MQEQQKQYIEFIGNFEQKHQFYLAKVIAQLVANLSAQSADRLILIGEFLNEVEIIPYFQKINNLISMFSVYFAKSMLCYLFKDYERALEHAITGSKYSIFVQAEIIFTEHSFYYCLILLAQYFQENSGDESKQQQYLKQVEENQRKMKYWAFHCPMNYQHKYDLVEAEKARVLGQSFSAMEYYDLAIDGAKENGYVQDEALANELAGEFYLLLSRSKSTENALVKKKREKYQ